MNPIAVMCFAFLAIWVVHAWLVYKQLSGKDD